MAISGPAMYAKNTYYKCFVKAGTIIKL